ncbi:MAG: aminotransferase class I/II-fold pyridoxal phosphate-dependent enzyme [Sphaerochaetaceae bacterium]|nr:aminotransferase class I/II-fold pyridoxal phosphate-dependent enzyme [Sphaerochaetaceae bacterium]
MNKRIYLSSPTMHSEEMEFIQEAFDTNWVAPLGKNVDEFEKEMASFVGVKHAAALVSGTSALHLAIKLCGVKRGDIVLCSDLTFSATVNPVSYEGGVQIFIDSERDSWNMDPEALEIALKKHPNAKAVLIAHLYGTPAKMDEIKELCDQYYVPLIEDVSKSLGVTYKGFQFGSFGLYSVLLLVVLKNRTREEYTGIGEKAPKIA